MFDMLGSGQECCQDVAPIAEYRPNEPKNFVDPIALGHGKFANEAGAVFHSNDTVGSAYYLDSSPRRSQKVRRGFALRLARYVDVPDSQSEIVDPSKD
jgi:hypothetical protein